MKSVVIDAFKKFRPLAVVRQRIQRLSATQAKDPEQLSRIVNALIDNVDNALDASQPRYLDFEDVACGASGAEFQLAHNFGQRARYWVVDWISSGSTYAILINDSAKTDLNNLWLKSYVVGTATIRVQVRGA